MASTLSMLILPPTPPSTTGNMGPLIRSLRHMCGPQGGRLFLQVRLRFC